MKPLSTLLLGTALALALPLAAQDASIGARAHVVGPMGDLNTLTNNQIGIGGAVFVAFPVSEGLVLRPLIGVQYIPKGDTLGLTGTKTRVASIDFMMEGLWYPGGDPEHGAYLVGAVGGQQWHIVATGDTPSTINATRLGVNGGLGYQASLRLGVEVRGFWSPVNANLTATGLMIGVTMKF
ncbi:MAG: hypothetical protein HY014_03775 [Acidobacteria bacterium]|nr:hypothetical protein [Acidobacteriota bacterium]MBI3487272.1 hypothetical protein [Acidobacteriota bacterium]